MPEAFRFEGAEVGVKQVGSGVILLPIHNPWAILESSLGLFVPGFVMQREQPETQIRDELSAQFPRASP